MQARLLVAAALAATPPAKEVASFGIITDVHYADADTSGTRYYRDSLPKVRASIADLASRSTDFLIELGDFKDTDVGSGCGKGKATPACINLTLSFLATIEAEMATFPGPRFHLLGNHDVDVLNQSAVLNATTNSPVTDPGGPGYYSFDFPFAPEPVGNAAPLRFIALNGDYTADDVPWADLDGGAVPGESWDDAHVPTTQME